MCQSHSNAVTRAALVLVLAASGASAQRTYVAPTPETVFTDTEAREGSLPTHVIFVTNRSTVPVTVFSVSLASCRNVKQACGPKRMNLRVAPGQRLIAMRLEPKNPEQGFGYRFGFSWRADSANAAVLAVLAAARDSIAQAALAAVTADAPDPHAPAFAGRAMDADSKTPLSCALVALEDTALNVVSRDRTTGAGTFVLQAPRPGTYRVRVDMDGWSPAYGPPELAKADEEKQREYLVRFTEQLLIAREDRKATTFQHASPAAVATLPLGAASGAKTAKAGSSLTPIVDGVTLGGSASMPVLGIIGRLPPMSMWMQFVVDSTGRVDTTSIVLPAGTAANATSSVRAVLSRVRFSPARDAGIATCELVRMQVNFILR